MRKTKNILIKIQPSFIIGMLLIFAACASQPIVTKSPVSFATREFFDSSPFDGELVVIGVATESSDHNKRAIKEALNDASRKTALFFNLEGSFEQVENRGSGFLDYSRETKNLVKPESDADYVEKLKFDPEMDVFHDARYKVVFVRARYGDVNLSVNHKFSIPSDGKKPEWVETTPYIPGYYVGVGYANYHGLYKNTVIESYENAALAIIRTISSDVQGDESLSSNTGNRFFFRQDSNGTVSAAGVLESFCVLEIWRESGDFKGMWTLAVAKIPK
ncbi:MAG: LPP20 family lipoprotein [Treponema sp.]|nr:LPP20 family lipoprotein [Treponema sp.]